MAIGFGHLLMGVRRVKDELHVLLLRYKNIWVALKIWERKGKGRKFCS